MYSYVTSMSVNASYATLDEAWGPAGQLATLPPNPYKNPAFQRQVLDSAASVGIVPREPQVLDSLTVKTYLEKLYRDSGPVAVSALLPAKFTMPVRSLATPTGTCFMDDWGVFWKTVMDPDNMFLVLGAAFGTLLMFDMVKV